MGRGVPSQLGVKAAAVHDWLGMQGLSDHVVVRALNALDRLVEAGMHV